MDIRDRIKDAIAKKPGATVRNISLAAGLSDSALNKFLTRQTKSITIDSLERIAEALGVSSRYLQYGEDGSNVEYIFKRIPEQWQGQALKVLESFADEHDTNKRA